MLKVIKFQNSHYLPIYNLQKKIVEARIKSEDEDTLIMTQHYPENYFHNLNMPMQMLCKRDYKIQKIINLF